MFIWFYLPLIHMLTRNLSEVFLSHIVGWTNEKNRYFDLSIDRNLLIIFCPVYLQRVDQKYNHFNSLFQYTIFVICKT